jgi:NAD(P)-dependent dehydrogenase (short-subunit alcohol dehydrogenase family)
VNNAAAGDYTATEALTLDKYESIFNTNGRGPLFLVKEALPYIPHGGRIINIASFATRTMLVGPGIPPMALYTASKIAIEGLTYAWAAEFGRSRGINVNGKLPSICRK